MASSDRLDQLRNRSAPLDMSPEEFRQLGHQVVNRIAELLESLPGRPVTPADTPGTIRQALRASRGLPEHGVEAGPLLEETTRLLFDHSLFNGHPRFLGYITSAPAPIGMLGDLIAAAVNPNVGAWPIAPMATEIEAQTVRWIAELIGYPVDAGGLLVSGGNLANIVCFLAARSSKASWKLQAKGLAANPAGPLRVYASTEVHTWINKAMDISGLGTESLRWIQVDDESRMDLASLKIQIDKDISAGDAPFLVVGTASTVSTGAIDPLAEIAALCRERDLWFHVDGAYGALAAAVPEAAELLEGMSEADSVAVDPHKWLYAPLEAGCALVRDPEALRGAFSHGAPYYHFGEVATNYFEYGLQNSRGFRALKVWLALQQVGRSGYVQMIGDDIHLARALYDLLADYPEIEPLSQNLSITTFRYIPQDLLDQSEAEPVRAYLNELNRELLARIESSGEIYLSNAIIHERFALRICVVNFRTSLTDIESFPEVVTRLGRSTDEELRPQAELSLPPRAEEG
ncbi:MAG: aminotransferase class V-fold PLP-dependent enzyme [Thermoanaerobaculia bacterium]